jgi:chromosome segregation ATPase
MIADSFVELREAREKIESLEEGREFHDALEEERHARIKDLEAELATVKEELKSARDTATALRVLLEKRQQQEKPITIADL